MDPSAIRKRIKELGIRPSKKMGQHYLLDSAIANRQVHYAGITESDVVLEIGPGLGILTEILSKRAKKIVAIEADPAAADYVEHQFDRVEVVRGDVLKIELPPFNKVVSNLPFSISSPITFRLLEEDFDSGILMYQKEFAERLVAHRGSPNYSRLSVNAYYKARTEILETIPRTVFYPRPKVDASIVRISPRNPPFQVVDEDHFFRVVKALFSHRRKQIGNSLKLEWNALSNSKHEMYSFVSQLANSHRRVEELSPKDLGEISNWMLEGKFNLDNVHHKTSPALKKGLDKDGQEEEQDRVGTGRD